MTAASAACGALLVASVSCLLWLCRRWGRGARERRLYALPAGLFCLALGVTGEPLLTQKLLAQLVMPAGLLWLSLLGLSGWALCEGRGRFAAALGAVLALYWLCATGPLASALHDWLQAPYTTAAGGGRLDALVVLGGGTSIRPDGTPQLGPSGDRIATAARLYRRGDVGLVVCTGTALAGARLEPRDLGNESAALLAELGVPRAALEAVPGPRNTSEELRVVARLVRERGWQRVGLVTSAWHMRRALRLGRRHGLELWPVAADYRSVAAGFEVLEVIPNEASLLRTRLALWELCGALVGR